MITGIIQSLLFGAIGVGVLFFVIWLLHLVLKNAGIVDIGWGLGFIVLCAIYISHNTGWNLRNGICFAAVAFWGFRIAFFLLRRMIREREEDKRYQKIRKQWDRYVELKFLFFFLFQAFLQMIISVPFLIMSLNSQAQINIWEISGIIICTFALIGESIADEQLQGFKKNPLSKGKTCDVGLWRYSRHPNYFFEWLVWVGFFLFACGSPQGWVSIISPILMYCLIMFVSGVPLAEEEALKTRGENYRLYQERTSVFFPLPPKLRN